jgi:Flp pilus assembly CpaE family ATPase
VLGLVENMSGLFVGPDTAGLAADSGIPFLGSVPFDRELALAADRGEAFVAAMPDREAARALGRVAHAVQESLARGARP